MILEHLGHLEGVFAVSLHSYVKGAGTPGQQEGVHGVERCRDELLDLGHLVKEGGRTRRDGTRQQIGMSPEVLGGTLDGHVDARGIEGTLMVRSRKGTVDHDPRSAIGGTGLVSAGAISSIDDVAHGLEVGETAGGIGGRLAIDHLGIVPEGGLVVGNIRRIDKVHLNVPKDGKLLEEFVRAAVDAVGEDGMVAGLEHRHEGTGNTTHAGIEQQSAALSAVLDALQRGDLPGGRLVGRGAPPAVDVAVLVGVGLLLLGVQTGAVIGILERESTAKVDGSGQTGVGTRRGLVQMGALGRERGGVLGRQGRPGGGGKMTLGARRDYFAGYRLEAGRHGMLCARFWKVCAKKRDIDNPSTQSTAGRQASCGPFKLKSARLEEASGETRWTVVRKRDMSEEGGNAWQAKGMRVEERPWAKSIRAQRHLQFGMTSLGGLRPCTSSQATFPSSNPNDDTRISRFCSGHQYSTDAF